MVHACTCSHYTYNYIHCICIEQTHECAYILKYFFIISMYRVYIPLPAYNLAHFVNSI